MKKATNLSLGSEAEVPTSPSKTGLTQTPTSNRKTLKLNPLSSIGGGVDSTKINTTRTCQLSNISSFSVSDCSRI